MFSFPPSSSPLYPMCQPTRPLPDIVPRTTFPIAATTSGKNRLALSFATIFVTNDAAKVYGPVVAVTKDGIYGRIQLLSANKDKKEYLRPTRLRG